MRLARPALAGLLPAVLAAASLHAQTLDLPTRLRVDSVFRELDRTDGPGCALLVRRDGATVHARGYGMASLEHGVAITPRTVMDIGSTSKQVTALAVWLLVQDGRVALDEPVQRYLPELPVLGAPVTVRQLLQHTSGWRDYIGLMELEGRTPEEATTAADAMATLRRQHAGVFAPGSAFRYSNTGFFLAAQLVERVSGTSMRDFVRTRIFAPLGMTQSDLFDSHDRVVPGRALGYARTRDGWVLNTSNWQQTGDGAVLTSVEDLARWDANFETGTVGGLALLDSLQRPGRLTDGTPITYAYGLFVDRYRGVARVHHGGAWAGYRAMSMRFPAQRLAIYVTCNTRTVRPDTLAEGVADVLLDGTLGPRSAALRRDSLRPTSRADVAPLEGAWLSEQGDVVRIAADDSGGTVRTLSGRERGRLHALAGGAFVLEPEAEQVDRVQLAPDGVLHWDHPSGASQRFTRLAPAPALEPRERRDFTGEYASEDLALTWRVTLAGDTLRLVTGAEPERVMTPLTTDAFAAGGHGLRFRRDTRGRVAGFDLFDWGLGYQRWRRVR